MRVALLACLLLLWPALLHAQERVDLRSIFGQGVRSVLTNEDGDADTTSASGVRLLPGQIVAAVQEEPISLLAQMEIAPPPPPPPPPGPGDPPLVGDPPPTQGPATQPLVARLPEFLMLDSSGATALQLTPIVLAQQGLRFTGRAYQAVLYLGVSDNVRPNQATALSGPFAMQILSAVGSVAPGQIEITHTNPPYVTATLSLERAPEDSLIEITVLTASSPLGARVAIPVHPSRISIEAIPPRIQGLGLERADIVVEFPMEVSADSVRVTLRSTGARPDPVVLQLRRGETATATIRSARVGTATVQAVSPALGLASAPVTVQFAFPIWFLASALLGGLVGGLVAWLRGEKAKRLVIYLLGAVLTGLLVAVLYVVGLIQIAFPAIQLEIPYVLSDMVVFALAALGAIYGLPKVLGGAPQP